MKVKFWIILAGVVVAVFVVFLVLVFVGGEEEAAQEQTGVTEEPAGGEVGTLPTVEEAESELGAEVRLARLEYLAGLSDVTGGKTILGLNTGGNATGTAQFEYKDGGYTLQATFPNLPEPAAGTYYEGWVVRETPFDFVSTGVLFVLDGTYTNLFSAYTDFSDHLQYVLTIEPDDGDPAPADHILEGTFSKSGQ